MAYVPLTSPYVFSAGFDSNNAELRCSFDFDEATALLLGATVHRDPGCVWVAIIVGDPNDNPKRIPSAGPIPEGDTAVSQADLNTEGFVSIHDVLSTQITAVAE